MNPTPQLVQAGPVEARYENGFLRYLTVDGAEILRMIYFAIRDRNWTTASLTITDEEIEQQVDSFRIQYNWLTNDLGIQMTGHVLIQGDSDGSITVDFYGKALSSFQRNRIGICVLHPLEGVLGQPAEIVEPDGNVTTSHFPTFISPHQPFLTIKTLRWQAASGAVWQVEFAGDVFETEDQRNWTDASFKTYSTPLSLPFPVTVLAGDKIRQQVVFSKAANPLSGSPSPQTTDLKRSLAQPTKPRIGVGQWAGGPPLTDTEATQLRQLNLTHVRVDVFFRLTNWETLLQNAIADAKRLSVPLELAVFFGNDAVNELATLWELLNAQSASVHSILLFNLATLTTSNQLLQTLVPTLREEWPDVLLGGGTDDNFAELNRNRFDFELVDFVTYSINPQAHASDDLTLLENIAGQVETVQTAKHISGGKPIHISPVTLRSRYTTIANTAAERLAMAADPRQQTEFGAEWTRLSLDALSGAGVESITYYQSHGPAGLIDGDTVYPLFSALKSR